VSDLCSADVFLCKPCTHAGSHGAPGGGTIVSRDSPGEIHVFFGHGCGHLYAWGETLEEFYRSLRGCNSVREVFLMPQDCEGSPLYSSRIVLSQRSQMQSLGRVPVSIWSRRRR
jgi:hypothetical protein